MQKPPQKRLGRGLNALISVPDAALPPPEDGASVDSRAPAATVPIRSIRPNPFQPRKDIPPEQLKALAESIREKGVLQPIMVRSAGEGLYELIAGERRWRAAQMAGLADVPAVVREADDRDMLELALVENIFRQDLNAIERAQAYRRYCDEFELSPEEVAQRLDEDRTTVVNYIRLLDLSSEVKSWVCEGKIAMGHARSLLGIKSPADQARIARQVIEEGLSVRAVEKLVRDQQEARAAASKPAAGSSDAKRAQVRTLEEALTRSVGTRVEIKESRRKGRGKLVIHYYSLDDFDRISEKLGLEPQ